MKRFYLLFILTLSAYGIQEDIKFVKHIVKKNETLSGIAQKYGTTIKILREINGIRKHDVLKYGRTIVFPKKVQNLKKSIKIITLAKTKLGRKYVWGAEGKNVFDCSGLTQYIYKICGINIPRRAIWQSRFGKYVSRKNLKKGDLVFFDTSKKRKGYVNHVGIYIGDNKFIHASSAKRKVVITSLNKNFYSKRFTCGRRVTF